MIDRLSKVEAEVAALRELVKLQSSVLRSIDQKLPAGPDGSAP